MYIQLFLIFLIFTLVISLYILIRNFWVHKQQLTWIDIVYNYRNKLIKLKQCDKLKQYSWEESIKVISSYDRMLFSFRWNLKAFVRNQKLYDLITKEKNEGENMYES